MSDKFRTSVEVCVTFTGTNGQTTFADVGPDGRTLTRNGNLQVSTSANPFGMGDGSGIFDGNGDYLSLAHSADFSLANTTPFCIESFFQISASGKTHTISSKRQATGAQEHSLQITATGVQFTLYDATPVLSLVHSTSISLNTWYYMAAVRDGSNLTRLMLGVPGGAAMVVASGTQSAPPATSTQGLTIGREVFNVSRDMQGRIGYYRFTRGVQRYTRFPYSVPSGPYSLAKRVGVTGQGRSPVLTGS